MAVPGDGTIGTLIMSNGVQYVGITYVGGGWWFAVLPGDVTQTVVFVQQDDSP